MLPCPLMVTAGRSRALLQASGLVDSKLCKAREQTKCQETWSLTQHPPSCDGTTASGERLPEHWEEGWGDGLRHVAAWSKLRLSLQSLYMSYLCWNFCICSTLKLIQMRSESGFTFHVSHALLHNPFQKSLIALVNTVSVTVENSSGVHPAKILWPASSAPWKGTKILGIELLPSKLLVGCFFPASNETEG